MGDGKLTPKDLSDFADRLNADTLGTKARFGIFSNGGHDGDSHIKANTMALKLFTAQLLEALRRFEEERESTAVLDDEAWADEVGDTVISHIELVDTAVAVQGEERPETMKDHALKVGCLLTLVFFLVSMVTGFVTIFKWLF